MSEFYTVVNRCSQVVKATWDGKHYELGPYESGVFEDEVAYKFKARNPVMGSLDPRTGQIVFYVGIKEKNDPITKLDQEVLIDAKTGKPHVEVWNREHLTGARPSEVVPGDNGLYSARDWKNPQSTDLNFDGR